MQYAINSASRVVAFHHNFLQPAGQLATTSLRILPGINLLTDEDVKVFVEKEKIGDDVVSGITVLDSLAKLSERDLVERISQTISTEVLDHIARGEKRSTVIAAIAKQREVLSNAGN